MSALGALLRGDRRVLVGLTMLASFALLALVGPWLVGDPTEPVGVPYQPPSRAFWLGTSGQGQDVFAQLVAGAAPTLLMAFAVGVAAVALGALVGIGAGAIGGKLDVVAGLVIDVFLVLPGLPLVVVVGAYLTGGPVTVALVLALTGWAWPARVLRTFTLGLRERDFVAAAAVAGEGRVGLVLHELLPNLVPVLVSALVTAILTALGALVGLEFLGLGEVERVSWGTMLYFARNDGALITGSWWMFVPTGVCVALVGAALALVGSGIDQLGNRRLRIDRAYRSQLRALGATARADAPTPVVGEAGTVSGQGLLQVRELAVDYLADAGRVRALAGVSFGLVPGEVLGLCGESGSGKSSLALALLRLLPPPAVITGGAVRLGDDDLLRLDGEALRALRGRRIGLVPQSAMNALNPLLPVGAQIADALEAHEGAGPEGAARARAQRVAALLTAVGLAPALARAFPHELSGGMRQRVVVAIAIAARPELVILDEATSALDVIAQRALCERLLALARQEGFALIFISHDLPLTLALCRRVGVLQGGRLVELATATALRAHPAHAHTQALLAAYLDPRQPRAATAIGAGAGAASADRREGAGGASVVEVRGLGHRFVSGPPWRRAERKVLQDVAFHIAPGEVVALVGASGAGKTTIARVLAGLVAPSEGEVVIGGRTVTARGEVQVIFQDPFASLNPARRIFHHIARPLRLHGKTSGAQVQARVYELLETVGLRPAATFAGRFPHELSGGQRQRVGIARALATEPRLLVADEPASMLDATLRAEILALLAGVTRGQARGLLYITHDLGAAAAIADRILVLSEGRIVEAGPAAQVLRAPAHPYTAALLNAVPDPAAPFAPAGHNERHSDGPA